MKKKGLPSFSSSAGYRATTVSYGRFLVPASLSSSYQRARSFASTSTSNPSTLPGVKKASRELLNNKKYDAIIVGRGRNT